MRGIQGLAAALLISQMTSPVSLRVTDHVPRAKPKGTKPLGQTGPVHDTTPESKRAKRRRLARIAA